jgi:uncharacterized membrane protein
MNFIYPLLAILGENFGKVTEKLAFKKTNITPPQDIFLSFIIMFVGVLIVITTFGHKIPKLSIGLFVLVVVMVIVSYLQNIFEAKGLKAKDLSFREPITDIKPVLISFLAFILFPSEREIKYIIGIILGSIILYFGNRALKQKLNIDKGTIYTIMAVIFSAILANIYKLGLETIPADFLFLFRTGGILILLLLLGKINFSHLQKRGALYALTSGLLYLIGSLASLYSIQYLGLNFTIMLMLLGPVLIYFLSYVVLKEKIPPRRIITSILLMIVVLGITFK